MLKSLKLSLSCLTRQSKVVKVALSAALIISLVLPVAAEEKFGLGRAALPEEIAAWDIDVLPDGRGLPKGSGDAIVGEEVFAVKCAICHGDFAEGVDNWPVLAGGFDTLGDKDPVKTVGSYWPHLSTVWDYINRSMPFGAAQTLSVDEVYAITAYILYSNDLIEDDFVLSHENFADFEMYNKDGFVIDDREKTEYPLWRKQPCIKNCKQTVAVTMRASVLDVTPEEENDASEQQVAVAKNTGKTFNNLDEALVSLGKKQFIYCQACHQVGAGAKNGLGPHLHQVVGREFAAVADFTYSKVFETAKAEQRVWDEESLAEFIKSPMTYMAGTKMAFGGLPNEQDVKAIIEYLKSVNE